MPQNEQNPKIDFDSLPLIEVHPAYMFDCNECGAENFIRAISAAMTSEEAEEMLKGIGMLDEHEDVPDQMFVMGLKTCPRAVQCKDCGARYIVVHNNMDDPDATDGA